MCSSVRGVMRTATAKKSSPHKHSGEKTYKSLLWLSHLVCTASCIGSSYVANKSIVRSGGEGGEAVVTSGKHVTPVSKGLHHIVPKVTLFSRSSEKIRYIIYV